MRTSIETEICDVQQGLNYYYYPSFILLPGLIRSMFLLPFVCRRLRVLLLAPCVLNFFLWSYFSFFVISSYNMLNLHLPAFLPISIILGQLNMIINKSNLCSLDPVWLHLL